LNPSLDAEGSEGSEDEAEGSGDKAEGSGVGKQKKYLDLEFYKFLAENDDELRFVCLFITWPVRANLFFEKVILYCIRSKNVF
jgi:hypothetical protein